MFEGSYAGEKSVRRKSMLLRALTVSLHLLIGLLALAGTVAILETPIVMSKVETLAAGSWSPYLDRFDHYLKYGAIGIAAISATLAVMKLDKIISAFRGYRDARAPIYELAESLAGIRSTLESLKDTMGSVQQTSLELSQQANKIKELQSAIEKTDQAVKDAVNQLADMERLAVFDQAEALQLVDGDKVDGPDSSSARWEELRALWNNNGSRIDAVRSSIEDGRVRARFMRMPRTNYPKIIDALADEGFISETARTHSLRLHRLFMASRTAKALSLEQIGEVKALEVALENDFKIYERRSETTKPSTRALPVNNTVNAIA